jgi:sulfite exporter TauE/SafE
MEHNVGAADKIVRIVVGLVIIVVGLYYKSWWGMLGTIPLITAALNYCPLYSVFKWSTLRK